MLIVFAIAGAVVLFAVAAAAVGRADGLDAAPRDLESPYLPDGPDRMDQVDEVLDRLSTELAARDQYIAALERTIHAQPGMPPSP